MIFNPPLRPSKYPQNLILFFLLQNASIPYISDFYIKNRSLNRFYYLPKFLHYYHFKRGNILCEILS